MDQMCVIKEDQQPLNTTMINVALESIYLENSWFDEKKNNKRDVLFLWKSILSKSSKPTESEIGRSLFPVTFNSTPHTPVAARWRMHIYELTQYVWKIDSIAIIM